MARYLLAAAATFGLESVVASELRALGCADPRPENGRVLFNGSEDDLARASLWLRAAERLLVCLSDFPAGDFDALYEGVRAIPWADFLPSNPRLVVTARSVRSRLTATPSVQSVGKKAIVDALSRARGTGRIEESGPLYPVEISLAADRATVTLDASGEGLHRRGYRTEAGQAPLKETLAAGMVLLSRWDRERPFADPLCGSGTLPIEAALIALDMPPGGSRSFTAEAWPHIPAEAWRRAREEAASRRRAVGGLRIAAGDRDAGVIARARRNAGRAGVEEAVSFAVRDLAKAALTGEYGCIVTNPPYAERLGDEREAGEVARLLGRVLSDNPTWSLFALSAHRAFEKSLGARATRNRKLYNGNLQCYFYQYFGPLPRRAAERPLSPEERGR